MRQPTQQLPLYETCSVCGGLVYGFTTGLHVAGHNACSRALDLWIRDDNLDYLTATNPPWHGQRAAQ